MGGNTASNRKHGTEQHAPRAIIHKQILDHADANPEASMEAIADAVSGATTATVERVLEQFGDPAADEADEPDAVGGMETGSEPSGTEPSAGDAAATEADDAATSAGGADAEPDDSTIETEAQASDSGAAVTDGGATSELPDAVAGGSRTGPVTDEHDAESEDDSEQQLDWSSLTEKQRETLRAISDHPDATQAELADMLGVSSPTISQRVNSIDGFDWSNRQRLVEPLFDTGDDGAEDRTRRDDEHDTDSSETDGGDRTAADATDEPRGEATDRERRRSDPARGDAADGTDDPDADDPDADDPDADDPDADDPDADDPDADDPDADDERLAALTDRVDNLTRQLVSVERELESLEEGRRDDRDTGEPSVLADPELAHKIVHACVHSDRITEEEELRLLRDVTAVGARSRSDANASDSE